MFLMNFIFYKLMRKKQVKVRPFKQYIVTRTKMCSSQINKIPLQTKDFFLRVRLA